MNILPVLFILWPMADLITRSLTMCPPAFGEPYILANSSEREYVAVGRIRDEVVMRYYIPPGGGVAFCKPPGVEFNAPPR